RDKLHGLVWLRSDFTVLVRLKHTSAPVAPVAAADSYSRTGAAARETDGARCAAGKPRARQALCQGDKTARRRRFNFFQRSAWSYDSAHIARAMSVARSPPGCARGRQ
ncbi:hypothetical protein, partial [Burkholderia multivorans]